MPYSERQGSTGSLSKGGQYKDINSGLSEIESGGQYFNDFQSASAYNSKSAVSAAAAAISAVESATSASASLNSELAAQAAQDAAEVAAGQAQIFSSLGLPTGFIYDFGFVTDNIITFPTDWGNV
jgi:hypothetical protein